MDSITVDAEALRHLLVALNGPPHYIRELQVTMNLPSLPGMPGGANPITVLTQQFNEAVDAFEALPEGAPTTAQGLFAELYQVLGAHGASAKAMDQCLAAANGEALPHGSLLPYAPESVLDCVFPDEASGD